MGKPKFSALGFATLASFAFGSHIPAVHQQSTNKKVGTVVVEASNDAIESFAIDGQGETICYGTLSSTLNVLDWKTRKTSSVKMPDRVSGVCWCEKLKVWYVGLQDSEVYQVAKDFGLMTKVSGVVDQEQLGIGLMVCGEDGTVYADGPGLEPRLTKIEGTKAHVMNLNFEGRVLADVALFDDRIAVVTTDPNKGGEHLYMVDAKSTKILWHQVVSKNSTAIFVAKAAFVHGGSSIVLSVAEGLEYFNADTGEVLRTDHVQPNEYAPSQALVVIEDGRAIALTTVYGIKFFELSGNQLRDVLVQPRASKMLWNPNLGLIWINDAKRNDLMWLPPSALQSKIP